MCSSVTEAVEQATSLDHPHAVEIGKSRGEIRDLFVQIFARKITPHRVYDLGALHPYKISDGVSFHVDQNDFGQKVGDMERVEFRT